MDNNSKKYFSLEKDLINFFIGNTGKFFSIKELDAYLNSIPYDRLKSSLSSYYKEPVDATIYLQSLCSYLEKRQQLKLIKDSNISLYGLI